MCQKRVENNIGLELKAFRILSVVLVDLLLLIS